MDIAEYVAKNNLAHQNLSSDLKGRLLTALKAVWMMVEPKTAHGPIEPADTATVSNALAQMYQGAPWSKSVSTAVIFGEDVGFFFDRSLGRELKRLYDNVYWATVNQPWSIAIDRQFESLALSCLKSTVMGRKPQVNQYVSTTAARNIWSLTRMAIAAANLNDAVVLQAVLPLLELAPRAIPLLLHEKRGAWLTLALA